MNPTGSSASSTESAPEHRFRMALEWGCRQSCAREHSLAAEDHHGPAEHTAAAIPTTDRVARQTNAAGHEPSSRQGDRLGLAACRVERHHTVLDVSCGGGRTVHKLAGIATVGKVYGIDHSAESVRARFVRAATGASPSNTPIPSLINCIALDLDQQRANSRTIPRFARPS